MRITLDRVALKALIDSDPQTQLDLSAAVVSEVARRFFRKDSDRIISKANPELFAKVIAALQEDQDMVTLINRALDAALINRPKQWGYGASLTAEARTLIDTQVDRAKDRIINEATTGVAQAYQAVVEKKLQEALDPEAIDRRVENRLERLLDAEIDRRVNEKLNARIQAVNEALKG